MLERFANDKELNRLVEEYFTNYLKSDIILKVLKKESVVGYAEALEIIQNSFTRLRNEYTPKEKKEFNIK